MKSISFIFLFAICSLSATKLNAQKENFSSRSSIGVILGGSYYIGDLNPYGHFRNTNFSGGLIYRYYLNSRVGIRGGIRYGKVEGHDAQSKNLSQQARNLSFESNIFEFSGGIEFNYLDYKMGNEKYFFSPYMFVDLGVFKMNPRTMYKGGTIELQPLGTEGQGSELSDRKNYALIQVAIPIGLGFKLNLGKRAALSLEYGIRKTFTDYLDDVGHGNFINREDLEAQNGGIAAQLSNQSLEGYKMTGKRGNPKTKDWYSMFGIMFTFTLGEASDCYYR